jgi:hypothetical protein
MAIAKTSVHVGLFLVYLCASWLLLVSRRRFRSHAEARMAAFEWIHEPAFHFLTVVARGGVPPAITRSQRPRPPGPLARALTYK